MHCLRATRPSPPPHHFFLPAFLAFLSAFASSCRKNKTRPASASRPSATSALRAYHHVYKGDYTPWGIADFLILNTAFPRSVAYCYRSISRFLDDLAELYGEKGSPQAVASEMVEQLDKTGIDELFQHGLHEFVSGAITTTRRLSFEISKAYHF